MSISEKDMEKLFESAHRAFPSRGYELIGRYSEPHRRYHGLNHILTLLELLPVVESLFGEGMTPDLEKLIWAHDAIYDGKKDAEIRSGEEFFWNSQQEQRLQVARTKDHQFPQTFLEAVFFDMDLYELGSSYDTYEENSRLIKEEVRALSSCSPEVFEETWRTGRMKFLESRLAYPLIYHTALGAQWEEIARNNMAYELKKLQLMSE